MKPIENYDLVNEAGEFKRVPPGAYGVVITNVIDNPEREYLEVYCDITKGEYANYFKSLVESGMKDSSLHIRSYKTKALPFFKAFITAIEKTNPGYKWDWDEKKLIGKKVIAVFGEEEYRDNQGNIRIASRVVEYRSYDAYKEGRIKIPELKKLPESSEELPVQPQTEFTELSEDELPF